MGLVNNMAAAAMSGGVFYGVSASVRHHDNLGDGWIQDKRIESAGINTRNRYQPLRAPGSARYIKPPSNAGDPNIETADQAYRKPWKWNN